MRAREHAPSPVRTDGEASNPGPPRARVPLAHGASNQGPHDLQTTRVDATKRTGRERSLALFTAHSRKEEGHIWMP